MIKIDGRINKELQKAYRRLFNPYVAKKAYEVTLHILDDCNPEPFPRRSIKVRLERAINEAGISIKVVKTKDITRLLKRR